MLWIGAIVLGLVIGLLGGGNFSNLGRLQFRWPWLLVGAVLVREVITFSPLGHVEGAQYAYAASLLVIVGWTIWHVRRLPGVWLITAGAALNLIVVLANSGRMPVVLEIAQQQDRGILAKEGTLGQYTVMGANTHLNWLADWVVLPPLPQAYSPGDVLVAIGLALIVVVAVHREPEAQIAPPKPSDV